VQKANFYTTSSKIIENFYLPITLSATFDLIAKEVLRGGNAI